MRHLKEVMTREEALSRYKAWLGAEQAIAANKSYVIDGLTVTRQDAHVIQNQLRYWERALDSFDGKPSRSWQARPCIPTDRWGW